MLTPNMESVKQKLQELIQREHKTNNEVTGGVEAAYELAIERSITMLSLEGDEGST